MVVSVVVEVDHSVHLAVHGHVDVVRVLDALAQGLSRVFFHLDVEELPGKR